MRKKLITAAVLCLIMTAALLVQKTGREAFADDYYGRLDPFTGERVNEDGTDAGDEDQTMIWLSDRMYYDLERRMYGFPMDRGVVYSNVADGMITRENVTLSIPDGMGTVILQDGAAIEYTGQELRNNGNYVVQIQENGQTATVLTFTITGARNGRILNYSMPDGFRIVSASKDGEIIGYSRKFVDMSVEGSYTVSYECPLTQMSYTLYLTVDTTPPVLTLEGVGEDGKARGPVTISGKGEYDTLNITKDGEPYSMIMSYTLTQSGRYVVTVSDEAGNVNTYQFTIMIYLDRNGWIFTAIFVLLIIGIVVYVHYHRTHLKVR